MTKEIPLSQQGKYKGLYVALVDDRDFDFLSKHKWCVAQTFTTKSRKITYAARQIRIDGKQRLLYMHDEIIGIELGNNVIDHIDWNGLNNTRSNLRVVSQSKNKLNKYQYK